MTAASAAAHPHAPIHDPDPKWLEIARTQLGTHEGVGPADNPRVLAYFAEAMHPEIRHDSTAWCAAFVGAMLHRAGIAPDGSLAARSYEVYGQALHAPIFGCIAVKKRPGPGWLGHVGFCVGASQSTIILLAGNQGDAVSVASFPRSQFPAFRWPPGVPIPKNPRPLPASVAGAKADVSEA